MSDGAWKLKIDPPESDSPIPMWTGTMTLPDTTYLAGFSNPSRSDLIAAARKFKADYLSPPVSEVVDI